MPRSIPSRDSRNPQHLNYLDFVADYSTNAARLLAGTQIGSLPIGSVLLWTQVTTEIGLTGGTPAAKVGTTIGGADIIASNAYAAQAIGGAVVPVTAANFAKKLTVETPVYYQDTGAATTAGKLHITLVYRASVP